ncbi:MAG: metal-sensing transcriptional repressor [Methylophilaceae bacterium]|nr:metal-sensing transcriptional repressor [Methylophilaceae bacterium]
MIPTIERTLEQDSECIDVLQQITSCRGAINGLLGVVLEDHISTHLVDAEGEAGGDRGDAREQLIDVVHSYLK